MGGSKNTYALEKSESAQDLAFFFISKGEQDIVRAIQYSFVQKLDGKDVYNLGFGDYDIETDTIIDKVNTNNGDLIKCSTPS